MSEIWFKRKTIKCINIFSNTFWLWGTVCVKMFFFLNMTLIYTAICFPFWFATHWVWLDEGGATYGYDYWGWLGDFHSIFIQFGYTIHQWSIHVLFLQLIINDLSFGVCDFKSWFSQLCLKVKIQMQTLKTTLISLNDYICRLFC